LGRHEKNTGFPWPAWIMLGWGIGLVFNYAEAYRGDKETMAEKEYEKLKKEKEGL
jgi:2TM domain